MKKLIGIGVVCLLMYGCSENQLLSSLEGVVVASEATVAALQIAGKISANTASQVNGYLHLVQSATLFTTQELQSGDSKEVKVLKITQNFAQAGESFKGIGAEGQVIAIAVDAAIQAFLGNLNQSTGIKQTNLSKSGVKKVQQLQNRVLKGTK